MEFITVIIVSMIVALLNSAHVILQWIADKQGETFTGISHFFADYFLYVGAIAQGAAGRWIWAEHLFTNEPMQSTWYYWFYVTLGHIGSWIALSPFATYNVSLIILVFLLCLVWYWLSKLLYPINTFFRLTTWLLILTMTNYFSFARPGLTKLSIDTIEVLGQFWFSPSPVFARLGGVPYHAAQMILFILLAITFSRLLTIQSSSRIMKYELRSMMKTYLTSFIIHNSIFLILLSFFAGSANPVQMLLFGASAGLTAILTKHGSLLRRIGIISLILAAGGAGAMLSNMEFSRQAVFTAARSWELAQHVSNSLPILLLSIGPILFFVPFGVSSMLKQKQPLSLILMIWGMGSFLLFLSPIPRLMGLSPVRFLHPVSYAASLAILGTEGLRILTNLIHNRMKIIVSKNFTSAGLLTVYFLLTIPAISKQFMDRITPARNPQLLMDTIYNHVPAPIVEALMWLKTATPHRCRGCSTPEVVLTDPTFPIEVLVPVFTGLPSFSGHPIHTLYPDVKEAKRQEFFGGKLNAEDAMQFLTDHRIGYIITIPSRRWSMSLQKVFTNATVTIYKSP